MKADRPTDLPSPPTKPRWLRIVTSNIFLGFALTLVAWPYSPSSLNVVSGIDPSWVTSLAVAAHNRLPFGTQIVFTFGPLGFLQHPQLNYRLTAVLSLLFVLALSIAIFGALIWSLRRVVPLAAAVVAAYVVGVVSLGIGADVEFAIALVLIVCVSVLSRTEESAPLSIWIGLGVFLSVFSLLKLSLGPGIVAVLIVTVACLPTGRWRAIEGIAIGAIPTFCLAWFGTGNGFGNMLAFAKTSTAIITGYASAQSVEAAGRAYAYWLAVLVVVLVGAFTWASVGGLSRRSKIGIGIITLVTVWMIFKEGFVRHDAHDLIFFAVAPLVLAAFAPRKRPWALVPGVLVLTGIYVIAVNGSMPILRRPDVAVRNLSSEAATLVSSNRSAAVIDQSRQSLRKTYALPSLVVSLMQGQTVDVSPWEQNIAWAYPKIRFDPLPVIQDYSAYTPSLDQLDVNYLASSDAPRFILRQPGQAIDGRDPTFEPPGTQLAIECRYYPVAENASWQLLERGNDRCGPLRPLDTVTTGFRHWVTVPTPTAGNAVVARFQLSLGLLYNLENVLFKPENVSIQYNGKAKNTWRFVAATAPDPHLLQAASTLGYPSRFTPIPLTSLRFSIAGGYPTSTGVTVRFYEVHVAPVTGGIGQVLPPTNTKVVLPANGTTVSGTVPLAATSGTSLKVTKVQFKLTGASGHAELIATGTLSIAGWVALWNTATVANGRYMLQSVVSYASGKSSESKSITVTVSN